MMNAKQIESQANEIIKRLAEYRKVLIVVDSRLSMLHGLIDHTIDDEGDRKVLLEYLDNVWEALPDDVAYFRKIRAAEMATKVNPTDDPDPAYADYEQAKRQWSEGWRETE